VANSHDPLKANGPATFLRQGQQPTASVLRQGRQPTAQGFGPGNGDIRRGSSKNYSHSDQAPACDLKDVPPRSRVCEAGQDQLFLKELGL
jgi:hypothetical protein